MCVAGKQRDKTKRQNKETKQRDKIKRQNIEATTKAKAEIDTFRKSIGLEPKFEKVEEAKGK